MLDPVVAGRVDVREPLVVRSRVRHVKVLHGVGSEPMPSIARGPARGGVRSCGSWSLISGGAVNLSPPPAPVRPRGDKAEGAHLGALGFRSAVGATDRS